MNGTLNIRMGGIAETKLRYIQIRPSHALEECNQKLLNFERSRMLKPAMLVLGFETYQNLCLDLARNRQPTGCLVYPGNAPKVRGFKDIPISVNDEECWGVLFCPPIEKAWPQYGKDDWVDHWRPDDVAENPVPNTPPVQVD